MLKLNSVLLEGNITEIPEHSLWFTVEYQTHDKPFKVKVYRSNNKSPIEVGDGVRVVGKLVSKKGLALFAEHIEIKPRWPKGKTNEELADDN